jgi:hypothetical protein
MKRLMIALGMIVSMGVATVAAGTLAASAPSNGQVCPVGDGWFKYEPGGWQSSQPDGVSASIDGPQATITVANGFVITEVCVKAGSANQGLGPESWTGGLPLAGPGQLTVWHSSGKDISHISVKVGEGEPGPNPSPSPSPTDPGPTPEPTQTPGSGVTPDPAGPAQPQPGDPGFAG